MQRHQDLERWLSGEDSGHGWTPAVDVCETATEIVLFAELPGMTKADISIQLHGDTLLLGGERSLRRAREGENFHRIERRYGAWQRTFRLETPIATEQISASYEHGVLTVRLPKQSYPQSRRIEIDIQ